jgi:hypothetical protein
MLKESFTHLSIALAISAFGTVSCATDRKERFQNGTGVASELVDETVSGLPWDGVG